MTPVPGKGRHALQWEAGPGGWGESGEDDRDTIAAISTAVGAGAVGIVRVSGPEAVSIAERVFAPARPEPVGPEETFKLVYGHVVDPRTGEAVDEALLAVMREPRSYTREDVAEFQCHGGAAAVREVLRIVVGEGARIAEPGEFTRRAFLNGRVDLAQAESVAAIVTAKTSGALRAAVRQLGGGLSDRIVGVRRKLLESLARVEVTVDFADEDVDPVDWQALRKGLEEAGRELSRLLETALLGRALEQGVRTVIVGRPNVGKSSLLNALAMRERAIVSKLPGTTRDTVEAEIEVGGVPLCLVDTAGLRAKGGRVERLGVQRSVKAMQEADLVLAVIDLSAPLRGEEGVLGQGASSGQWILVGNKMDLVEDVDGKVSELKAAAESAAAEGGGEGPLAVQVCAVSALTGEGVDRLRAVIESVVTEGRGVHLEEPLLVGERQRVLVEEAAGSVAAALGGLGSGKGEELLCEDLRVAIGALGRITGEDLTGDLMDEIFSRFCIGK